MLSVDDELFEKLIGEAMDELPEKYVKGLDNVLVTYEDEPTAEQRVELKLHCNQTLFGLYQGVPRTQRGNGYNMVLPDKITIFKNPIVHTSSDIKALKKQIKHTIWHEIAHHYGLDHDRIHSLEG
ncbi:MAG TPA: metallopeptidase family protein [Candidatus Limnocylindria bacterium]|nr:metallopeptidase family protein [Candidatus Limnocylindria bacterium]